MRLTTAGNILFRLIAAVIGMMCMLLAVPTFAQTIEYSESFTGGTGYSSGSSQYDNWISFRAAITGPRDFITVKGSLDPVGRTCSDPTIASQIAAALNTGATSSFACDGNTWQTGTCGSGAELLVGAGSICQCGADYTVRPTIGAGNDNWGGLGGATCAASTQTMTVTVGPDTVAPTISVSAPIIHDNSVYTATFQFSEAVSNFDISDITVTNGSASNFVTTDSDTYTADITPTSGLDVTVSVASGTAQDLAGNILSNSDQAVTYYLPTTGGGSGLIYSESFTGGTGYSSGSSQWDNWISFRAGLTGTYQNITVKGSLDTVGKTCAIPSTATQIANALNAGSTASFSCSGETWKTGTCGAGIELLVGSGSVCTCGSDHVIRPTLGSGNQNWGGLGGNNCSASSQVMTVELSTDSTPPAATITDVPATTDGSTPFVATFSFSEDISGMTLADITAALTNAVASGLTETIPNRRYTVTITPNGAGDVSVGLNAAAVQDTTGNDNTAATPQVAVLQTASFSINKSVDLSDISVPITLNYTITVTNTGSDSLTSPILTDTVTQGGIPRVMTTGPTLFSGDVNANNILDAGEVWIYNASYGVTTTDISNGNDIVNSATFDTAETTLQSDDVTTTISPIPPPPPPPVSCSGTDLAVNGGFEAPDIPASPPTFTQASPGSVPGWSTTDTAIELWDNGYEGVPAHSGLQFAELNANNPGTLTQTASASGRAELLYFWAHRARDSATETSSLTITDDAGGSTTYGSYSSATSAWSTYSTIHVTNPGATSFSAAHSTVAGGSIGNFHDTIEACQTYITLGKSEQSRQDVDASTSDTAGDTITYRFVISNPAGNERSLGSVKVIDDKMGTVNIAFADSGDSDADGLLDPGEAWIKDEPYTVTQADMDTGSVVNVAYAEADTSDNTLRSDDASETAALTVTPALTVTKTASPDSDVAVGEDVTYTYVVTNTGNQTISDISLSDAHGGTGTSPVPDADTATLTDNGVTGDSTNATTGDGVWDTLAPGDVLTTTATYTITQQDIDTLQ